MPEEKIDQIRDIYYGPLETADRWGDRLFYVSLLLAAAAIVAGRLHCDRTVKFVNVAYVLVALGAFALSLLVRTYFMPRAEDARATDFASSAFGAVLQPDQTERYYNNGESPSFRRMVGLLAENAFFSKTIARKMCSAERTKVALATMVFLLLVLLRDMGIDWIVLAAQVVTSEQVISKGIRLEVLRAKFEKTYQNAFDLLTMGTSEDHGAFKAKAVALVIHYESAKANAAVLLSGRIFSRLNKELTSDWDMNHKPKLRLP